MASGVLIIIETSAGNVRATSLELLGPAREVADGGQVAAVVIGSGVEQVAGEVAGRGADHVLFVDAPGLARYTTDGYTKAIEAAITAVDPTVVLFPGTTAGRDLGPYVAARAGATCLSDCVTLRGEDGALVATRPVYQGKMLTDVRAQSGERAYAVMRGGVATVPEATGSGSAEPLAVEINQGDLRVTLKDVAEKPTGGANLEGAETVVVGGRGVGSAEGFGMIEELAAALDAPVGATRAVTDLGWRPHYEQIGQTGKTVRPKLYIGAGVSGAVQHTVGMQGSETVVVINRDPDAPLLKFASIGVIGDLNELLPALTKEIKAARGKS
jgi:electron transfer flavoprotein alpha subunit